MAKVTYTCFAVPPEGILIGKVYETGKDDKGFFYADKENKTYCDEAYINMLFTSVKDSEVKTK